MAILSPIKPREFTTPNSSLASGPNISSSSTATLENRDAITKALQKERDALLETFKRVKRELDFAQRQLLEEQAKNNELRTKYEKSQTLFDKLGREEEHLKDDNEQMTIELRNATAQATHLEIYIKGKGFDVPLKRRDDLHQRDIKPINPGPIGAGKIEGKKA